MTTPFTEVIFIDEGANGTLDINDLKTEKKRYNLLHNVKRQTAKPFIDASPW